MTMIVPRRSRSLFDPFMNDPFDSFFGNMPAPQATPNLMRTDIKETEGGFEIVMDLPGFDKENVAAELKDGILKVSAKTTSDTEENTGTDLRRERFTGQCSRQFYVGEDIEEADIKAKFDNGTLQISVPKKAEQPKLEESRTIAIEG
ncbi:MAG: Hsp20/alpha crystallin family protein [Eggerthellaceae bacterium]|nr:Hsp20/alpha crystallin family protein [Eggerthellaceae bacterium]